MRAVTPATLSPDELSSWLAFRKRREPEVAPVLSDVGCSHLLESIIWDEFLRHRWCLSAAVPFTGVAPLAYAQRTAAFGPDLGAMRGRSRRGQG
jgi:hypothetical protein